MLKIAGIHTFPLIFQIFTSFVLHFCDAFGAKLKSGSFMVTQTYFFWHIRRISGFLFGFTKTSILTLAMTETQLLPSKLYLSG